MIDRQYPYDIFISYSHADGEWVRTWLLPRLEAAGLKVQIDYRDFEIGVPALVNMERAIDTSRFTLAVLTPNWVASEWTDFESLLVGTSDSAGRKRRLIPLMLSRCELPSRIAMLTYADFLNPVTHGNELARLLRTLGTQARVFISYKRNVEPDELLAKQLHAAFEQAGHYVFIDQHLKIGVDWAKEIDRQIEASDFVVVLMSEVSLRSEMVVKEVEYAHRQCQQTGKSRLLPVRVNYTGPLPYDLSHYLDGLQHAEWYSETNTEWLMRQLLDVISDRDTLPAIPPQAVAPQPIVFPTPPASSADPRFIDSLDEPSGVLRLQSEFYIEREGDERLRRELNKRYGTTTTLRAPRQTGKSSLLIRGITQAKQQGSKIVFIDLQPVDASQLQNLDVFLRYFATVIVSKLRLDTAEVEKAWRGSLGASDKLTYLMEDYVLPQIDGNIVLAIDEADVLLKTPFHDTFFGLLRFWHNSRAMNDAWDNLDLLMVISTEPHLLISDVTQSPFNVGLKLTLGDFNQAQVEDLNRRYRQPVPDHQLPAVMDFLNGHPYLTSRAMYTMLSERISWEELTRIACTAQSPFGDHLRRYLWLLRDQPQLRDALKHIILHTGCADETMYYRLLQAGLIKGANSQTCTCRCRLYEEYFKDKL